MKKFMVAILPLLVLVACSQNTNSNTLGTESPLPSQSTAKTLPNDISIPQGAEIVSGPTPATQTDSVAGWSAVATAPSNSLRGTLADQTTVSLTTTGWSITGNVVGPDATTITAHKGESLEKGQWVEVIVTNITTSAQPVLTYKYVATT